MSYIFLCFCFFFFNDTATTEIYTLSLHDALPIWHGTAPASGTGSRGKYVHEYRSEEHTSELQSRLHLVCRLLLEKKKKKHISFFKRYLSICCMPVTAHSGAT